MTKQERAFELKKRGYSNQDIADIVGWDLIIVTNFFKDEEVRTMLSIEKENEFNTSAPPQDEISKGVEIETLDDRLAATEHRSIGVLLEGLKTANINDARRVFESVGRRRTELAKQTGSHKGDQEKNMGRAVVININAAVAAKLVKNDFNQITEVNGRVLQTLDRDKIKDLTKVEALDMIEASLEG